MEGGRDFFRKKIFIFPVAGFIATWTVMAVIIIFSSSESMKIVSWEFSLKAFLAVWAILSLFFWQIFSRE